MRIWWSSWWRRCGALILQWEVCLARAQAGHLPQGTRTVFRTRSHCHTCAACPWVCSALCGGRGLHRYKKIIPQKEFATLVNRGCGIKTQSKHIIKHTGTINRITHMLTMVRGNIGRGHSLNTSITEMLIAQNQNSFCLLFAMFIPAVQLADSWEAILSILQIDSGTSPGSCGGK